MWRLQTHTSKVANLPIFKKCKILRLESQPPKRARAGIAPATRWDVGLVVQAVRDDVPLATMYAVTPADGDHSIALARLERSLRAAIA